MVVAGARNLAPHRAEQVKTPEIEDGRVELRTVTGSDYAASMTTNMSQPCSASPAMEQSIRA